MAYVPVLRVGSIDPQDACKDGRSVGEESGVLGGCIIMKADMQNCHPYRMAVAFHIQKLRSCVIQRCLSSFDYIVYLSLIDFNNFSGFCNQKKAVNLLCKLHLMFQLVPYLFHMLFRCPGIDYYICGLL